MNTKDRIGTEIGIMTGRIKKSFRNGKESVTGMGTSLVEQTRRAARKTDYYVHDNAWMVMAVTAGVALAAGYLLARETQELIEPVEFREQKQEVKKGKKVNSWEFVHSAIPLALFIWKAVQSSRYKRDEENV